MNSLIAKQSSHFMLLNIFFEHKMTKSFLFACNIGVKGLSLQRVFHGIRFKVSEDGRRETTFFF